MSTEVNPRISRRGFQTAMRTVMKHLKLIGLYIRFNLDGIQGKLHITGAGNVFE